MEDIPKENQEVKYSSYTEAQKKATKKYRENNKEKVNEQRKKYYLNRKEKDPNFLEYKRTKAREYYQKKKALKKAIQEEVEEKRLKSKDEEALKLIEEEIKRKLEEVKLDPNVHEHFPMDETVQEKKKRRYNKKNKTI